MDRKYKNKLIAISSFLIAGVCSLSFSPKNNSNDSNANFVDITFSTPFGVFKDTKLKTSTKKLNKELKWSDAKVLFDSQSKSIEGSPKYSDCSIIDPQSTLYTNPKWYYFDGSGASNLLTDDYQFNYNTIVTASFDIAPLTITFKIHDDDKNKAYIRTEGTYSEDLTISAPGETTYGDVKVPYIPTITADDYIFSHYVDEDGNKVTNDHLFTKPETLTAVIINNPGRPESFVTDDWNVLLAAANKGYTSISTLDHKQGGYSDEFEADEFEIDGTKKSKPKKSFVGLERYIDIGGIKYRVRVVDENVDFISSSDEKAVLTFEFVNLIHPGKSFTSNYANSNVWSKSDINYYLNNTFFKLFPSELQSDDFGIRTVKKYTNKGNGAAKSEVGTVDSKLFIPSLNELNITEYPDGTVVAKEGLGNNHDTAYKYYGLYKDVLSTSAKKTYLNASLVESDYLPYWTRTPDIDTPYYAYDINKLGAINSTSSDILHGKGIPCYFCIGADLAGRTVTFDVNSNGGNWGDETTANIDCKVAKNGTFADAKAQIPTTKTPTKSGCVFDGWYTSKTGGTKITNESSYVINQNFTAYAHFTSTAGKLTITFKDEAKYNFDGSKYADKEKEYTVKISPVVHSVVAEVPSITDAVFHTMPTMDQISVYKTTDASHTQLSNVTITTDGILTIPKDQMKNNITIEVVYSRIALDWDDIVKICEADEAAQGSKGSGAGNVVKKYFDVGDVKPLDYNGKSYDVRIIDLAHSTDTYNNGAKIAAITFEFVDCLGESKYYDSNNHKILNVNYENSTLKQNVDASYTNFNSGESSKIKSKIKSVNKEYLISTTTLEPYSSTVSKTSMDCNFFALSAKEYNGSMDSTDHPSWCRGTKYDEGTAYPFYEMLDNYSKFTKLYDKVLGNTKSGAKYLNRTYADHYSKNDRSPYRNLVVYTYYDSKKNKGYGRYQESGNTCDLRNTSLGFSPGFCI